MSYDRWPRDQKVPRTAESDVVPDLAVEVVSPSNSFNEVERKVGEYFAAGVTIVWVVSTDAERVYAYDSPVSNRILTGDDRLELPGLIPGFSLSNNALFAA